MSFRRRSRPKTLGRGRAPPLSLLGAEEKPVVGGFAASLMGENYGDEVG
jgi:hypothetical protein